MTLTSEVFRVAVGEANLAPSVHNTQPTRWRQDGDSAVVVFEVGSRRLPVGDPAGRDAGISHGAAIEGFALALGDRGFGLSVEALNEEPVAGLRAVARLTIVAGAKPDPLRNAVAGRRTFRGAFLKADCSSALTHLGSTDEAHLVRSPEAIARLAKLNDEAGLRTFRDEPYRAELLSWMRLSKRHPRWMLDGLNAEAINMSPLEAAAAGVVLRPGVFEGLDRLHCASPLVAEAKVVRSSAAVALFYGRHAENSFDVGRRFYRFWLKVTAAGLAAAPMAVLADDARTRDEIGRMFLTPPSSELITTFRIGTAPPFIGTPKPRVSLDSLFV